MSTVYKSVLPEVHPTCFLVDECIVTGDVKIGEKSNVWYYAMLRGDVNYIRVGKYTSIQDGALLHVTSVNPLIIGDYVTVGHGAKLHGCTVGDHALIGIGAIVLDGAVIGKNAVIAAGTVIPPNKIIPDNAMAMGNPYKIVREVREDEKAHTLRNCMRYAEEYPKMYNK